MRVSISLLSLLVASGVLAQPAGDVVLKQVNDRRTSGQFFAQLSISAELPKYKTSEVAASRVLLSAATDDTGRDLIDHEAREPELEANQRMSMEDKAAPTLISISMKNPDRKAKTVREVRGDIELFLPGKDPNSIAEIPKFAALAGKPLTHKALKANGVEITFLSKAQVDAERKKRVDAKRKEYAEAGYDEEALKSMMDSITEGAFTVEDSERIVRIKDPNHRIQELMYIDEGGQPARISLQSDQDLTRLSTWSGNPQPDWKLKVTMRTPKNTTKIPFTLKDVPLP
jgi:hypothetical protein